jgi:hypothetical protein
MTAQAAHLVDCVLPAVPIGQFVLSFPFELSLLAATKPEVLRALARIHAEELGRHYKQAAKKSGEAGKLHAGAVTFVQRFGSSLNLHVHLHTCALDGVYVDGEEGDAPRFVPAAPPSRAELYILAERVALWVMTWLRPSPRPLSETKPSPVTASTCTPASPSPSTMTSAEIAFAAMACVRRSRSRACASCGSASARSEACANEPAR